MERQSPNDIFACCNNKCMPLLPNAEIGRYAAHALHHEAVMAYTDNAVIEPVIVCTKPGARQISGRIINSPDHEMNGEINPDRCLLCPHYGKYKRIKRLPNINLNRP
jgi:hypothetical protein